MLLNGQYDIVASELKRADYALVISLGSLVAALMALGFQLWTAVRLDRATLRVRVSALGLVRPGFPVVSVIAVTVVNRGKRPTKLASLWLMFCRNRWSHRQLIPRRFRKGVAIMTLDEIVGIGQPAFSTGSRGWR